MSSKWFRRNARIRLTPIKTKIWFAQTIYRIITHYRKSAVRWSSHTWNTNLMLKPFCLFIMPFILSSVMEGRTRGMATQNRASWGGSEAPVLLFLFWPWRNFRLPWNCILFRKEKKRYQTLCDKQNDERKDDSDLDLVHIAWYFLSLVKTLFCCTEVYFDTNWACTDHF